MMDVALDRELVEKIRKIRLLILDVDGVLTEGQIVYDSEGRDMRSFDTQDGIGVRMLFDAGIETILVTVMASGAIERRAKDLKIERVYQGVLPKTRVLDEILREGSISNEEICCVGDDLVDLGMMKAVGFPAAPANARPEVKDVALYVTRKEGGHGAVREIAELILKIQGKWDKIIEEEAFG